MPARTDDLVAWCLTAIRAADPAAAVARVVSRDDDTINVGGHPLPLRGALQVFALGKAAPAMVQGIAGVVGRAVLYGCEVALSGSSGVPGIVTWHGSHPLPDVSSLLCGRRLLARARATPPDITTIVLVSGGGSALAEVPAAGVTLDDVTSATERLLMRGADIESVNTIRRHLSALKGGGLGAALRGPLATVALSDVVGSPPHAIASGPTVADPTPPGEAAAVAARYGVDLPRISPTPARVGGPAPFVTAADGAFAAGAVVSAIRRTGRPADVVTRKLGGDAAEAARSAIEMTPSGTVGVFAGETTVRVTGGGRGGRNQHAALVAAVEVAGRDVGFAAIGTDGIDGNSPAAGAVVDGATAAAARHAGVDLPAAIDNHDSYSALAAIGATIVTGPTGTNVGDVWIVDKS